MTDAQQPAAAAPAVGQKRKAEDDAEDKGAAPAADTRPAPVGFAGYAAAARGFGAAASGAGFGGFASVPLTSGGFGGFAKSAGELPCLLARAQPVPRPSPPCSPPRVCVW